MSDSIAVVSGGLDSVTMVHYLVKKLGRRPLLLLFDYGQRPVKEVAYAKWQALHLGLSCLELSIPIHEDVVGDINNYVPSRNICFLSIAVSLAEEREMSEVFCGFQADDRVWDCVQPFLNKLNDVLALNDRWGVSVSAPLIAFSKTDIVRLGLELDVDYAHTWSCFEGGDKPCGLCKTCKDRQQAFEEVGAEDPLLHAVS